MGLIVAPDGNACQMSAMRYPGRVTVEHERVRVLSTLDTLCELRKIAPNNLEIRTIDYLLEYGAFMMKPGGAVYIERYTFKTLGGGRKPKITYYHRDVEWHELISSEVEALWENGKPWNCS